MQVFNISPQKSGYNFLIVAAAAEIGSFGFPTGFVAQGHAQSINME